jgi:hypothetical protein
MSKTSAVICSTPETSENAGLDRRKTADGEVAAQLSTVARYPAGGHASQLRRIELFDDIGQEQNGLRREADTRCN